MAEEDLEFSSDSRKIASELASEFADAAMPSAYLALPTGIGARIVDTYQRLTWIANGGNGQAMIAQNLIGILDGLSEQPKPYKDLETTCFSILESAGNARLTIEGNDFEKRDKSKWTER